MSFQFNNVPQSTSSSNSSLVSSLASSADNQAQGVYLPFHTIKQMAQSGCIVPFVQKASPTADLRPLDAETSCFQVMKALAVIFSGHTQVPSITEKLLHNHCSQSAVALADKFGWTYKIYALFFGPMLAEYNRQCSPTEHFKTKITTIIDKDQPLALDKFQQHIQTTLAATWSSQPVPQKIAGLQKAFTETTYNFNKPTLDKLKETFEANNQLLRPKKSFIYYIAIREPASYEPDESPKFGIYHAFAIEQFLHPHNNCGHFRIYSTWRRTTALSDFFKKMNYQENGEGCFTQDQMNAFIDQFQFLVCPSQKTDSERSAIRESLFGRSTDPVEPPITWFDIKNRYLNGLSVVYDVREFDPNQCQKNFDEFRKLHRI